MNNRINSSDCLERKLIVDKFALLKNKELEEFYKKSKSEKDILLKVNDYLKCIKSGTEIRKVDDEDASCCCVIQ